MSESALTLGVFNQPMKVLEMFNRLDVSEIKKLKDDPYSSTIEQKRDDGVSVRRSFHYEEGTVWEEMKRDDSNFRYISLYSNNGILLGRSALFYNTRIASTDYKPSGKLVNLEDRRKNFKFKLDDLRNLMIEKYNIDILNKRAILKLELEFKGEPPKPYYFLSLADRRESKFFTYLVDGNTGEFLHRMEIFPGLGPMIPPPEPILNVYEDYLLHLKEQNEPEKK